MFITFILTFEDRFKHRRRRFPNQPPFFKKWNRQALGLSRPCNFDSIPRSSTMPAFPAFGLKQFIFFKYRWVFLRYQGESQKYGELSGLSATRLWKHSTQIWRISMFQREEQKWWKLQFKTETLRMRLFFRLLLLELRELNCLQVLRKSIRRLLSI